MGGYSLPIDIFLYLLLRTCVVMRRHSPRFKFSLLVQLFFLLPIFNNKYHAHSFQLHIETAPIVHHGDVYMMKKKNNKKQQPVSALRLYNIMHNIKIIKDYLETGAIVSFFSLSFRTLPYIRRGTSQPRTSVYFLHIKFFQLLKRLIFIHELYESL